MLVNLWKIDTIMNSKHLFIIIFWWFSSLLATASTGRQMNPPTANIFIDSIPYSVFPPINSFENNDTNRIVIVYIGGEYVDNMGHGLSNIMYYNDMKYFYQVARNGYHIPKDNIITLFGSGVEHSAEIDSCDVPLPFSWDLDDDGSNDLAGGATWINVEELFDSLAWNIRPDQHLLVVFDLHGDYANDGHPELIKLWDGDMYIETLNSMLNSVQCASQCLIFNSCFSGEFIPLLRKNGRIILTSAKKTTSNGNCGFYNYFIHRWTNAINGQYSMTYGDPDSNYDGHITLLESYDYASMPNVGYPEPYNLLEHPSPAEPQYSSRPNDFGKVWAVNQLPRLSGDLHIRDLENDWGQSAATACAVSWQSPDIWLRNSDDGLEHQMTEELNLSENDSTIYVYVRLNNNGYNYYDGQGRFLHLHWRLPSLRYSHSSWREHEISLPINTAIDTLSSNILCYEWHLPMELRNVAAGNNGVLNIGILARINDEIGVVGDDDWSRFPFEYSTQESVACNPKLAQLNIIPNTTPNSSATFQTNLSLKSGESSLSIRAMSEIPNDCSITYLVNDNLYVHNGVDNDDIEISGLQVDSIYPLTITCSFVESRSRNSKTIFLPIGLFSGETLLGGASFQMNVGNTDRPFNPEIEDSGVADDGGGTGVGIGGPIFGGRTLSMANVNEPVFCEWSDSQGNALGNDSILAIPLNANGYYKLSVRALSDNAIASVSKSIKPISYFSNITTTCDALNVELRVPAVDGMKLILRPVLDSIEPIDYVLNIGETVKSINVSSLSTGIYLLSLSVNGKLYETIKINL